MNDRKLNLLRIKAKIGKNLFLAASSYLLFNLDLYASAQVVRDNSLPNNSQVNQNGDLIEIVQGTTEGNNLFHSFEEFSIIQGETAWFQNATTIENIFTRVTGGSVSSIDGLIRANGTANLFFLNPNGIIFGANAQLDIGGSFVGTTADSLRFSDDSEFSAIDPQAPPLLTVNIAPGLQHGVGNGGIVVQGQGNLLAFTPDLFVDRSLRPRGLEVNAGNTLALVGNNISVEGGNLTAGAGNIELGSVGENSLVQLNNADSGWSLDYTEVSNFQDIILSQASSLDVSGNNGGDVQIQGKEVIITDGSAILADTFGDRDGGTVQVNASELLVVAGTSENLPFISRLSTDVLPGAIGNGGDIELNTSSLIITGGAQVLSSSYSSGNTGNVKVTAGNVELSSGSRFASSSGLFTLVFDSGNGGDVDIAANNISILDGAQAAALTFGNGQGGNINADAISVEVIGTSPNGISSSLATNSQGAGNGGKLTINGEILRVADGGSIQSSVFRSGNGGNLIVNVKEVELLSGSSLVGASGLFVTVEPEASGNGGNLTITAESLYITNGAQAAVTTFGNGDAGILDVKARNIELVGTSPGGFSSGLFSNVDQEAKGKGGFINLETDTLSIADGAEIATITLSSGSAGNIDIKSNEIEITGVSSNAPSAIFSTVEEQAEGSGGNIRIDSTSLKLINGAQIAVSTKGLNNAGELGIKTNELDLIGESEFGSSGVFGNAIIGTGDGGNITVTSNDLTIRDGATINVSNFSSNDAEKPGTGEAGSININAQNIEIDGMESNITAATFDGGGGNIVLNNDIFTAKNGAQVTAETSGVGNGGSITISANEFNLNNQGQISVDSTGEGQAGDIAIAVSEDITLDNGNITATSIITGGGDITLNADFTYLDNNSEISTSVTDSTGGGGDITINSDYVIANNSSNLRANAVDGPGGNINITTQALFFSADSEATASSEFGVDGIVEINNPNANEQIGVVPLKFELTERTEIIPSFCSTTSTNTMVVSGKGGLGDNPGQTLRGQSVWEDLRDFSHPNNDDSRLVTDLLSAPNNSSEHNNNQANVIIEANNWRVNEQGKLELISNIQESFNLCNKS